MLVFTGCGSSQSHRGTSHAAVEGPFGKGRQAVYVMRPDRQIRAVVVVGHGWGEYSPTNWRPWFEHLAAQGYAAIYPRYQLTANISTEVGLAVADGWRQGLVTGFEKLGAGDVPVVALGYSFGGGLVFYYAGYARRWHLPVPAAVQSMFPTGPIAGVPPERPDDLRVLIQVGDRDMVVGATGAKVWREWAGGRYEVVRSTPAFVADHFAPLGTGANARRIFWRPLDRTLSLLTSGSSHPTG